ncbi:MAG: hypothetical protein J6W65_03590 [Oscillospiraceae bacterium]|nr:hypothetical protein [Oscillospiraceae bacterium]MBQ5336504.1 hypothetical protein [Oscillospiraceae bacterium]
MVIEQTDIPEIKEAVVRIRELSEDEKAKQAAFQREMDIIEREMFFSKLNKVTADYNKVKEDYNKAKEDIEVQNKIIAEKDRQLEQATLKAFSALVSKGIITVKQAAEEAGVSVEEFEKLMNAEK